MTEPFANLSGVRAKLGRANEHLSAFEAERDRLPLQKAGTPFIDFRRDGDWHVLSVRPLPKFPVRLSLIAGDFFNNLRAVLDHLVWQLILREGKKPKETNAFPIFTSEEDFIKKVKTPLKKRQERSPLYGIPNDGDAWTIIEKAQPWFHSKIDGLQPRQDMLAALRRMSNFDKHRIVLVSMGFPDQRVLSNVIAWSPANVQPIEKLFASYGPLSHEQPTELMRLRFASDVKISMSVQGPFLHLTFGDEDTQVGGLRPIYNRVSQIVDQAAALPRVKDETKP